MFSSTLFSNGLFQSGRRGIQPPSPLARTVSREILRNLSSRPSLASAVANTLASRFANVSFRKPPLALCAPPRNLALQRHVGAREDKSNGENAEELVALLAFLGVLSANSGSEEQQAQLVRNPVVSRVLTATFCTVCLMVASWLAMWAFSLWQRRSIYQPSKEIGHTPVDYSLNNTEDLYLETEDKKRIHCWFIKSKNYQKVPTLLFLHGNSGNMSEHLNHVIKLREMDWNIFMVSYRGYGRSEGSPTEQGLSKDAQAALNYLLKRTDIDTKKIMVFGTCLGGAVAINLVANNPGKAVALILENTFTSLSEVFTTAPIFSDKYENVEKIRELVLPVMFLSGRADSLVPPAMMDRLYEAAHMSTKKHMAKIQNGDHQDTWMQPGYATAIIGFVQEILGPIAEQSTDPKS